MASPENRLREYIKFIYGAGPAGPILEALQAILDHWQEKLSHPIHSEPQMSERDMILITYGDQFRLRGQTHLQTLAEFLENYLGEAINGIHILPFFPYSSDDGFSVIDYREVNPDFGSWDDIARMNQNYRLMFDAVINHISRESEWFQKFLKNEAPYTDYFITVEPGTNLSMVVRPRALPLLTRVQTAAGERLVWTTFSEDQIDLDYSNPHVLLEIIDLLLDYVYHGAEFIRLDAIAYLWKQPGSTSIHLPQTHAVVKIFRAVLDIAAPHVILITETNVPHEENISYFGSPLPGSQTGDEAQLVYQFPLGPLVLHTFHTGNARVLSNWAASLETPYPSATFFNFIASHDGIGVRPAEGLLKASEIQDLVDRTLAHGGQVSNKTNPDGTESVYELNITLYDALNDPDQPDIETDVARFLASQAIMLALAGIPGIYVHSLFGSHNCQDCYEESGRARSLNREKFRIRQIEKVLQRENTHTARVFAGYKKLLQVRHSQPAFHPFGSQEILPTPDTCFGLLRRAPDNSQIMFCLTGVADRPEEMEFDLQAMNLPAGDYEDLLSGDIFPAGYGRLTFPMDPYQTRWLHRIY